jgi:hypothetical protein
MVKAEQIHQILTIEASSSSPSHVLAVAVQSCTYILSKLITLFLNSL